MKSSTTAFVRLTTGPGYISALTHTENCFIRRHLAYSDRVDNIGQRQKVINQVVSNISRKLSSMNTATDDQLVAMDGSIVRLTGHMRTEVAER